MADDSIIVGVGVGLGAAITGAVQAWRARRATAEATIEATTPEAIHKRLTAVEQQVQTIRHEIAGKVDRLSESVDELMTIANRTAIELTTLLPSIQRQIDDLKTDVRDIRGKE